MMRSNAPELCKQPCVPPAVAFFTFSELKRASLRWQGALWAVLNVLLIRRVGIAAVIYCTHGIDAYLQAS